MHVHCRSNNGMEIVLYRNNTDKPTLRFNLSSILAWAVVLRFTPIRGFGLSGSGCNGSPAVATGHLGSGWFGHA